MKTVFKLENPIQTYEWGSSDYIPNLLSRPNPSREPQAELWMGAHPAAPSRAILDRGTPSLDALISREPAALLGEVCSGTFGNKLPFLFKLLAAARPLSIQAHPDKKQAEDGWRRENEAGIPLTAAERNYRDDNHKPELLCALTPFTALCGFRYVAAIQEFLRELDAPVLSDAAAALDDSDEGTALRRFLHRLVSLDAAAGKKLAERAMERTETFVGAGSDEEKTWRLVRDFALREAGDPAIIAPLFLNRVELTPGRAVFLPAGILHSYVSGFGVEIMANSDNVLRGGLTKKHVDAKELDRVLRFEPFVPDVLRAVQSESPGLLCYRTPAAEFRLYSLAAREKAVSAAIPSAAPAIIVVTEGSFIVESDDVAAVRLDRGESAFIAASAVLPQLRGAGEAFIASVPR